MSVGEEALTAVSFISSVVFKKPYRSLRPLHPIERSASKHSYCKLGRQNKFDRMSFDIEICVFLFVWVCLCGSDHASLYVYVLLYLCVPFSC